MHHYLWHEGNEGLICTELHGHIHDAIDHTFHDICSQQSHLPYGGLSIVFDGDFQQMLSVIIKQ